MVTHVKEVQEAMLALRRAGYSSYLLTHKHQDGQPHAPPCGRRKI
jgi:hypothetical protein